MDELVWEGAELHLYINGEEKIIVLSDAQFAMIINSLGLKAVQNGISCFSDESLLQTIKKCSLNT